MEVFVVGCSNSWTERADSCYMIDNHILFDCGEGVTKNLVKCFGENKLTEIDYIFITHFHTDHIFGINQFLTQSVIYQSCKTRLTIVGQKGLKKSLYTLLKFATKKKVDLEDYLNIIELKPGENIKVDNYTITAYKLNHGEYSDFGFVIDDGKQKLGYTGDSAFDDNLIKFITKCDSAICDVSGMKNAINHMGVDGYKTLEQMFPEKAFYAVHCNQKVFESKDELKLNALEEMTTYTFENKKLKKI